MKWENVLKISDSERAIAEEFLPEDAKIPPSAFGDDEVLRESIGTLVDTLAHELSTGFRTPISPVDEPQPIFKDGVPSEHLKRMVHTVNVLILSTRAKNAPRLRLKNLESGVKALQEYLEANK